MLSSFCLFPAKAWLAGAFHLQDFLLLLLSVFHKLPALAFSSWFLEWLTRSYFLCVTLCSMLLWHCWSLRPVVWDGGCQDRKAGDGRELWYVASSINPGFWNEREELKCCEQGVTLFPQQTAVTCHTGHFTGVVSIDLGSFKGFIIALDWYCWGFEFLFETAFVLMMCLSCWFFFCCVGGLFLLWLLMFGAMGV